MNRLILGGAEGGGEWAGDAICRGVQLVGVPGDAFAGDLVVLAEVIEGEGVGGGIVFLVGEDGGLLGGFFFDAEAAVEDGEDVVSGEVVGIDGLEDLVLGAGLVVFALLVEREAEFAVGVAGAREAWAMTRADRRWRRRDCPVAFDESAIVECAGVVGSELERLVEVRAGIRRTAAIEVRDGAGW